MAEGNGVKLKSAILEALDDLSAAVDGFGSQFSEMHRRLDLLHNRQVDLENRILELTATTTNIQELVIEAEKDLVDMKYETKDLDKNLERMQELTPQIEEVIDNARRAERAEWLRGARLARAGLVSLP